MFAFRRKSMGVIDSQRTTYSDSDRSTAVDESSALLTARQRRRRRSAVEADYEIKSLQYPVKKTFPERAQRRAAAERHPSILDAMHRLGLVTGGTREQRDAAWVEGRWVDDSA